MPVPTPGKKESQSDFISRCLSSLADTDSDRPVDMRKAMCYTSWRRGKGIKASEDEMPEDLKIVFFDEENDFSALGTIKKKGVKFFRKPILRFGTWRHPDNRDVEFEITEKVVKQIADNFMAGIPVEAPIVLTHTDNPKAKVGGVKQFIPTENGLDAVFSVADEEMVEKIESKEKAPGVSCWLDLNYKDKQSNELVGAVVKHVALVNHPYIEGLGGYQAVSLSEDKEAEKFVPLIMSEKNKFKDGEDNMPKLTEILKILKDEHEIDVVQLQEDLKKLNKQVEDGELIKKEDAPALSEKVISSIKKKLDLSEDTTAEEAVSKLVETVDASLKLSEKDSKEKEDLKKEVGDLKTELTEMKAEKEIDDLITEGKVLPAEKEGLKKTYVKDKALFSELIKSRTAPLVELAEQGKKSDETPTEEDKEKEQKFIDKQVELAEKEGLAHTAKTEK